MTERRHCKACRDSSPVTWNQVKWLLRIICYPLIFFGINLILASAPVTFTYWHGAVGFLLSLIVVFVIIVFCDSGCFDD